MHTKFMGLIGYSLFHMFGEEGITKKHVSLRLTNKSTFIGRTVYYQTKRVLD